MMHQSTLFPLATETLYVREVDDRYRVATTHEILDVARVEVEKTVSKGASMSSPEVVKRFLVAKLGGLPHEVCGLLLLDSQFKLIDYVQPFRGTLGQAAVYPREIVKIVLAKNAAAIVMVHNHPSGLCEESAADRELTKHVQKTMALIDVRLLDHIIVAGANTLSFAERGLL